MRHSAQRKPHRIEMLESRLLLDAYHLTFDDEFNALNLAAGPSSPGWLTAEFYTNPFYSGEQQYYALQNGPNFYDTYNPFSVSDGVLSITAKPNKDALANPIVTTTKNAKYPDNTQPYLSGMLSTASGYPDSIYPRSRGFSQKYGYFEIRAKFPPGQGMFPALWLMPADGAHHAEYDIAEVPIKTGSSSLSAHDIHQTVHWGGYQSGDPHTNSAGYDYGPGTIDATADFHAYGFEWNPSTITWYVDEVATQTQINRCDAAMYLIMNLAIGGWPGNADATTPWPAALQIDYVRIYSADPGVPAVTPQSGFQSSLPAAIGTLEAPGTTYRGLLNGSFETTFSTNGYAPNTTGTAWSFGGTSGITQNGGLSNPTSPDGYHAAALQQTGSITQTFLSPAAQTGSYTLSFKAGSRGRGTDSFDILIDGISLGTYYPPSTKSYNAQTTGSFTLTPGTHTLSFQGKQTGDRITFIDDVVLNALSIGGVDLAAPTGLTATIPAGTPEGRLNLSWTIPAGSDLTGYVIERKVSSPSTLGAGFYSRIAVISDPAVASYADTHLSSEPSSSDGGAYLYRIFGIYGSSEARTGYSELASAVTMPSPDAASTQTPMAPVTDIRAISLAGKSLTLTWLDCSYYATGYKIERKTGSGGTWSTIGNPTSPGVFFTDPNVAVNTTYYYRITTKGKSIGTGNVVTNVTSPLSAEYSIRIPPAPQFSSSVISDGAAQRSMVKSLSVAFDSRVVLAADSIVVLRRGSTTPLPFTISNPSGDGRTYQLDYADGPSLGDGLYVLKISANRVRDSLNQPLAGADRAIAFHRLFGDVDGDRDVDLVDYRAFKSALNRPTSYVAWFDFNADGAVNATDLTQFRSRMTRTLQL